MEIVGRIFGGLFDVLLLPFSALSPGWSLFAISMVLGVLMLLAFKWIGEPAELELGKNRMQAHLMEMRLFDREPRLVFKAMGQLFWWNFRFFLATLKPMLVATAPMILLFVQMDHFYGYRPLHPGETTVVTAKLEDFEPALAGAVELRATDDVVEVQTPPVRSPARRLVSWRIRGLQEGQSQLELRVGEDTVTKSVTVGHELRKVSRRRVSNGRDLLLHPIEDPMDAGPVRFVELDYPAIEIEWLGYRTHWLVWLFFVSLFGALIVRWIVNAWRPGTL